MPKTQNIIFVILTLIILVACGGTKTQVVETPVEPELSPLQKARIAIAEGNTSFAEKSYAIAIEQYNTAIKYFVEAQPTASEADSIGYNIEVLTINIAKAYSDQAVLDYTGKNFAAAKANFVNSINTYKSFVPTTLSKEAHTELLIDLYRYQAYCEQNLKEFEAAISSIDQLLMLSAGNEEALNLKFSILNDEIKDENRAYQVLIEYAEVSKDAAAYITLANRYRDNKKPVEAATYYEKALEIKPEASVMLVVADFYRSISDWNKSTAMYERILATKPDQTMSAAIYRRMGENHSQAKNNPKMIEAFEKYLAIEKDAQIALLLTSQFNSAKNYSKVIQYATMVIGIDAKNSDAIMLRGMAYYNLKRNNEAKADFQRIQDDPKHGANAKKFLAAIK